ncbi:AI-2E family transporter [Liquorilactobacillus nagelii]|jgi:predicted PurR-regulated permease PerM|uniref:AI-2E family transporter n=1 Tax=Liquorilactobacillus nagelii TaxID=82688 RepID=UPI0039EB9F93
MKESKWIRFLGGNNSLYTVLMLGLIGVVIWIFYQVKFVFEPVAVILGTLLPPLVLGLVLYYVLNPLVKRLDKKLGRTWIISLIYCIILILLVLAGIGLFFSIRNQLEEFLQNFPAILTSFQQKFNSFINGLPFSSEIQHSVKSTDISGSKVNKYVEQYLQQGFNGFSSLFSVLTTILLTLFTGPIVAFFLLKDKEKFFTFVNKIIPPNFRPDFHELGAIVNQQIGGYLKGQIVASIILGLIYWPLFYLIGLKYATILALTAGIFSIIPYIGSFVAFLPGLIVAFQVSFWMAVKFVIVWFVVQFLHGQLVVPRVMGDNLQIHPLTVLLVLLVMGDLLGLVGVIFGIPIYCLIKVLVIYLFRRFKQRYNRFFGEKGKYEDTEFSKKKYLDK